ncbi:MAG: AAA family ATPase [candidate division Zixibacteria bacterium]|nr:AAA family ATPase [candidate division Zixibacteria bacterium]
MNKLKFARGGENTERWLGAKLVSVISGKGGVGKSVLAYNLAERISASDVRVLLVDTDFSCGSLHVLANQVCEYGIVEFARKELSLEKAKTVLSDNLHLLPSPTVCTDRKFYDPKEATQLLMNLRQEGSDYDVIIIDHSSGISEAAAAIVRTSDLNLITIVPELTSISDGYGLYKYLVKSGEIGHCQLLINRVIAAEEAENVRHKIGAITERFLGRPLGCIGSVPENIAVRNSVASQIPIAQYDSNSKVSIALSAMARAVVLELFKNKVKTDSIIEDSVNNEPAVADIRE